MDSIIAIIFVAVFAFVIVRMTRKSRIKKRAQLIDTYRFPDMLSEKLREIYPHLSQQDVTQVIQGLREYFHICNIAGGKKVVSMPSQGVDVAWHEFILFTKKYDYFCTKALGRFLHHTPAEAMSSPTVAQQGIKTAWRIACSREQINPKTPHRLPLLFALDESLNIKDGFFYSLNCKPSTHTSSSYPYCASHIGCGSGDRGGDDQGAEGDSGCGGGCGGD